jgi:hypothetical protein
MGDPRVLESPWVSILKWSNYNIFSDDLGVPSESMGDWLSCCSFAKWGFIGCSCLPVHWSSILPKPVARLEVSIVWREGRDSQSQKSWSHKYTASSRLHPMIQNYNTRQFKCNLWSLDSSWWLVVSHIHPYSSHLVDPEWLVSLEKEGTSEVIWLIESLMIHLLLVGHFEGYHFHSSHQIPGPSRAVYTMKSNEIPPDADWNPKKGLISWAAPKLRQIDRAVRYGQKFGSPVAPKSVGSFCGQPCSVFAI